MNAAAIMEIRERLGESGRTFLHWWLSELRDMVPASVRRRLPNRKRGTVWDMSGEIPRLWQQGEGWQAVEGKKGEKAARAAPAGADVMVGPELVFRKTITLPKMSASQARAALRLQLSRHVPFRPADVIFDCRLTGEDAERGTVTAELALMRRTDITALKERLSAYGVTPKRIGMAAEGPQPGVRFDFHERDEAGGGNRMHRLLALLAGVLALATLFAIEDRRAAEIDVWRATAAEQAKAAAAVKQLRSELTTLEAHTAFLEGQWQTLPRVELLESLSQALPDGTWLESIEITGSKVRITGYSDKASSVTDWLLKTDKFGELRFVSAVSSTAKAGVDRFDVEGQIR